MIPGKAGIQRGWAEGNVARSKTSRGEGLVLRLEPSINIRWWRTKRQLLRPVPSQWPDPIRHPKLAQAYCGGGSRSAIGLGEEGELRGPTRGARSPAGEVGGLRSQERLSFDRNSSASNSSSVDS